MILLSITLAAVTSGCYVSKKRDYDSAKFTYSTNRDGTLTITGVDKGGNDIDAIKVPRTIDGKTVTVIGKSAFSQSVHVGGDEKYLVVLPDTIVKIERWAFSSSSIIDITIPDSVAEIEEEAFSNTGLKNVSVPRNAKIADKAFSDSVNITYR